MVGKLHERPSHPGLGRRLPPDRARIQSTAQTQARRRRSTRLPPVPGGATSGRFAGIPLSLNALWRRERDSNPRGLGGPCGFQERRLTCCLVSLGVVLIRITTRLWEFRAAWYLPVSSGWGYRWGYAASPNWGTDSRDAIFQSSPAVPLSEGGSDGRAATDQSTCARRDEMGTHRSAPARSASPIRGCLNLPRWAGRPGRPRILKGTAQHWGGQKQVATAVGATTTGGRSPPA